jgi:hypothetical protein
VVLGGDSSSDCFANCLVMQRRFVLGLNLQNMWTHGRTASVHTVLLVLHAQNVAGVLGFVHILFMSEL